MYFLIYMIGAVVTGYRSYIVFLEEDDIVKGGKEWFPSDPPLWFMVTICTLLWPLVVIVGIIFNIHLHFLKK